MHLFPHIWTWDPAQSTKAQVSGRWAAAANRKEKQDVDENH